MTKTIHRPYCRRPPAIYQGTGSVDFDFDGDGKADAARWKSSASEWKIKNSSTGNQTSISIGSSSSIIAPGDFDGDLKTDAAVFSAGVWTIRKSSNGQTNTVNFGAAGDKPIVGDYDGDGISDCAVFRASTNQWLILQSSNANQTTTTFGSSGDLTAEGKYDNDSKTDIAIFRPSTGDWHVLGSTAGYFSIHWGISTDVPVPADYDGDGKTDLAVYRGSSGTWYISKSSTNYAQYFTQAWGNYGDQPVPADYNGDGTDDFAVWRPTTGVWHIIKSGATPVYDYQTLGQTGDTAVTSAYLKQIGGAVVGYDLAKARLAPKNSTGGTDLYSQNVGWGTSLVGLSGRAGMDAGFGISYNSLVWTKEPTANAVYFDADNSNISPGFRFGFPTIEPVYWDKDALRFNYLMVTSSGARVEFRQQNGASDTYETADSSYTQLKTVGASNPNDPVENISITVSSTDGTKMIYLWKAGAFRCSQIKDRNGNFLTVNHDEQGLLRTVTDTLGRVITVNYDAELYPISITQTWKNNNGEGSDVQYVWATFTYTNTENPAINTNFANGINIVGPANGTTLKVLQKITYPNGAYTTFEYNGYAQVKRINNHAADTHLLSYTRTNLENPAANQTDCPRLTETRSWTENFNQDANGIAQETVITNSVTENASYNLPDGHSGTATKIEVAMANHPHGAISKTFVGASGWMESLPIASEDWANGTSGSERKRWTRTIWTQDDVNTSELNNPRVVESKIGDATNIKRSTTEYYTVPLTNEAVFGLVKEIKVYAADQTTVLKKAYTEYNLSQTYLDRRIIGLPSLTEAWGFNQQTSVFEKVSKVTYQYDEGNFNDASLEQNLSTAIQHDNTNYGASFIAGRGNLTSTTRHDVSGQTASVTSSVKYNTTGAVVAQIDALGRTTKIGYADAFNDNQNRNTFAYPTKLTELANTDPTNNYSLVKYRFDTGANVWAKSPSAAGNPIGSGKETVRLYDALGRLERETLVNTGAYTRYEYPTNQIQSKVFATVIDTNNNGADSNDEVLSEAWTDGAGRVRRSRTEHPGSYGGYAGTLTEYDRLGQVTRSTVPTEIDLNWNPAGDDNRGVDTNNQPIWLWNSQEFDWMGRVVRSIPSDSNGTDGKDQLISYDGCGCAGGNITTIQSELVPRDDQPNTNARRTQKIYEDILGRTFKTEILNWNNSVYTTTVQIFNGRDQIAETKQYAGAAEANVYCPTGTCQKVSMTYDGHGRMKTRRFPIEDSDKETTWIYNADDSIQTVIDPRGALTNFTYNLRGLVEQISYDPPANQTTIPDTPTINFQYDALGNRTQMQDGARMQTYAYDQLSRLTSETRGFTGLSNSFTIGYSYHLAGGLKSYTDPFGAIVNYTHDKTGRLTAVSGTAFGDFAGGNYAEAIQYRAFGGVKQMTYKTDDNNQAAMAYDNRLRVSTHQITSPEANAVNGYAQKAAFIYTNDSRPAAMDNQVNHQFDRSFKFDFAGRLTQNSFGNGQGNAPYQQTIEYDSFSQMTSRETFHWTNDNSFMASYVNGRKQPFYSEIPVYDAAGNMTNSGTRAGGGNTYQASKFDAANRLVDLTTRYSRRLLNTTRQYEDAMLSQYDGDGRAVKSTKVHRCLYSGCSDVSTSSYQIWSSVLGAALTELKDDGTKKTTKIYAGSAIIAEQKTDGLGANGFGAHVEWITADPLTGSSIRMLRNGEFYDLDRKELEPLGQEVTPIEPYEQMPDSSPGEGIRTADEPEWLCALQAGRDFFEMPVHCQIAAIEQGISIQGILTRNIEGNPSHINTHEGLHQTTAMTARDLPVNATPTMKQINNEDDNQVEVVPASSIPSADGCTYDADGNPSCAVTSQRALDDPIAANNAENGFNNPQPVRVDDATLDGLKGNLEKLITDKKCGAFINGVISNLSDITIVAKAANGDIVTRTYKKFEGTILENFDRVRNGGGYWQANINSAGASLNQQIWFQRSSFAPNSDNVSWYGINQVFKSDSLVATKMVGSKYRTKHVDSQNYYSMSISDRMENTFTLVHELIHSYLIQGRGTITYTHPQMALAAQLAMQQNGFSKNPIPLYGEGAGYFDTALRLNCGDVKL